MHEQGGGAVTNEQLLEKLKAVRIYAMVNRETGVVWAVSEYESHLHGANRPIVSFAPESVVFDGYVPKSNPTSCRSGDG